MYRATLALLACALCARCEPPPPDTMPLRVAVLDERPHAAWRLAAAVEAALAGAGEVAVASVEPGEPLALPEHVCAQAAAGATAAVLGASRTRPAAAAAARAGLPLLVAARAPAPAHTEALALFPAREVLARVCADLCREKGWRRAVLLHEGGAEGAALLAPDPEALALRARRLPPPGDDSQLRNLLLVLKKSGELRFVVWCEAECAARVLEAAQRVGLLAERQAYIVLALDLHTLDLDAYSHGGANITGVRLFDPESAEVRDATAAWRAAYARRLGGGAGGGAVGRAAPAALLLAHRAARLLRAALDHLRLPRAPPADCETGRGAFHADTLLNYLRSKDWREEDAGGPVSWDADGGRRALQLEVVEVRRGGRLKHAGVWAAHAGVAWQRDDPPPPPPPPDSMTNRTFNVLIAKNNPYVMIRKSPDRLTGNDRYEGFCIELIQRLAEILHFNYTFVEQTDGNYGSYNASSNRWSGMIARLMDEEENMHFAITDLTITAERERAVDFTTPFMNLGISILFRKPMPPEPKLFAFLLPFSNDVWLCLGLAYVGTSLLLYVVGRLCPEEWQNPYPCIEEPVALENQFTLANALWFNLGAVLLQGSEIAPVAYGTRAVASAWWLFALVITSSYTANLATLLAQKNTDQVFSNVQELANNPDLDYGAKGNGSTYTFFEQSTNDLYKKMYEHMKQRRMPAGNPEGVKKVASSRSYAFLMESTTIEYEVERNCEVIQVGDILDSKGYGIAMRKNSTYRQALNVALLQLQEAGTLRDMKRSWWNEKNGGGACKGEEERGGEGLEMSNFRGLFLVLAVGCLMGVALSALDLAVSTARRARASREPFWRRFTAELRFVFRFENSVKPIHGAESLSSSGTVAEGEAETEPEERVEERAEERVEERGAEEGGAERLAVRGGARRRRSSMHAASMRLARHAAPPALSPARDSRSPASDQRPL